MNLPSLSLTFVVAVWSFALPVTLASAQTAPTPQTQPQTASTSQENAQPALPAPQTDQSKRPPVPPVSEWPAELAARLSNLQTKLGREPDNLNLWLDLGELRLEVGDFDRAKQSFLEAVSLDYMSADAHFGLGLAEFNRANYRAALFEFSEVTRLFPERFDGHFNRAVTLAQLRRSEEAVAAFQEALVQASPEAGRAVRASAQLGLAGQLEVLGRFDEAAEAYGAAMSLSKRTPELVMAQSEALYRAGRGLEALPALTTLEASNYQASTLIANIYLGAKQTDYALAALNRAQRRAAQSGNAQAESDILLQLGLLRRSLGRNAAAARAFAAAAKLTPESGSAFYNLGVSYLESGQPGRALVPLQNALAAERAQGRASGEVFLALATAYDQLGQPADAQRTAEAARSRLQARPLRLDAAAITGRALYREGNYRGALIALQEVAEARPNDAQAQLWAGLAYYQQGDYTEATSFYERAVSLSPDNPDARLNLGAAYLATERYADAESVYTLLTQQNPEDAEAFYNLGWARYSQGQLEGAQSAWTTASDLGFKAAQTALTEYTQ